MCSYINKYLSVCFLRKIIKIIREYKINVLFEDLSNKYVCVLIEISIRGTFDIFSFLNIFLLQLLQFLQLLELLMARIRLIQAYQLIENMRMLILLVLILSQLEFQRPYFLLLHQTNQILLQE